MPIVEQTVHALEPQIVQAVEQIHATLAELTLFQKMTALTLVTAELFHSFVTDEGIDDAAEQFRRNILQLVQAICDTEKLDVR